MTSLHRQRGVAAVVFLAIFAMIMIGVLSTAFSSRSVQNDFDAKTFPVLATAKEVLISYAASNSIGPGRLPCADVDGDGEEDCSAAPGAVNQLGRLPWKTLGLPMPRDGAGECLWYAVSGDFREDSLATPINSDSNGKFGIVDDYVPSPPLPPNNNVLTGATTQSLAIAVVFAPGAPTGSNDRTPSNPLAPPPCGGNDNAANYLDTGANGVNNAVLATSSKVPLAAAAFVVGIPSHTFNDRLVYITPAELFPRVERRVAGEIAKLLRDYYARHHYYPFVSNFPDVTTFACSPSATRGRLPETIASSCPGVADWADPPGAPLVIPPWFSANGWNLLTYYTLAPSCAYPSVNCLPVGSLLAVNGQAPIGSARALVIEAGRTLPGQNRSLNGVSDYLDGPENANGDDIYSSLPRSPIFNDVVIRVPWP